MPNDTYIAPQAVEMIANALGEIKDECVFIGGAVLQLYVPSPGDILPRPTMDVDVAVETTTYAEIDRLNERLAAKGIFPASDSTILYRYVVQDVYLDIIPAHETPLGPTNPWIRPGMDQKEEVACGGTTVYIMPVGYYLASKWEAFKGRGGDFRTSHDFEDIVYILDGAKKVVDSIAQGSNALKQFLAEMADAILSHPSRIEILECHLEYEFADQKRQKIERMLEGIRAIG